MGVDETGMGNVGDKILKHHLVADKTPGTEDITTTAWSGDRGLTLIELIVMVAIGTIFSGVILTFAAGAVRSYRHTSGGAQAQIEMQDALDQLEVWR